MRYSPVSILFLTVSVAALLVGGVYFASAAVTTPKNTKGISVIAKKMELIPFSLISIKGIFDPSAVTSVIFTTKRGEMYTIPAITVTKAMVEVQVPPVAYDAGKGAFTRDAVTLEVVQMRDGSDVTVTTSDILKGYVIASPRHPKIFSTAAGKRVPIGAIARSFLAASADALASTKGLIPADDAELASSFAKAQDSLNQTLAAVKTVQSDPKTAVRLPLKNGRTVNFGAKELAALDAIYAGYLGEAEERKLAVGENGFSLIPAVHAQGATNCLRDAMGEGRGDSVLADLYGEPCWLRDSMQEKAGIAGELLPEAAKFVYSMPLTMSGLSIGALTETMSLAGQVALSGGIAFTTDVLTELKIGASNSVVAMIGTVVDDTLEAPVFGYGVPIASFLYSVRTAVMKNKNASDPVPSAILGVPKIRPPQVKLVQQGPKMHTVKKLHVPPASRTVVVRNVGMKKGGYDIVSIPVKSAVRPVPTPGPSCSQKNRATYDACLVGCGSSEETQKTYSLCTESCGNIRNDLLKKSECINGCIGALSKANGERSKCSLGCSNAFAGATCP